MVIYIFGKLRFAMQYTKYLSLHYKISDLTNIDIHTWHCVLTISY